MKLFTAPIDRALGESSGGQLARIHFVEVDLDAVRHNVRELKPKDVELMAVVKSNSYGHGAAQLVTGPAHGTLTLSATLTEEQISGGQAFRLSVSDTGSGIPAAQRSRIFDPFFTTKDEGTGLGLAIVHAIIEAHRGRIDVESIEGRGTTFMIALPHHRESDRVETPECLAPDREDETGTSPMIGERHVVEEETSA